MKLTITTAEVTKFAQSMAPVTTYVDSEINSNLDEGETPHNGTGMMIADLLKLMSSKGLVSEEGPMTVRITKKGDLQVEIKEEFVMEYTQLYFKSVMQMIPPVKALMDVFKVQQEEMEALQAKWFPNQFKAEDFESFQDLDISEPVDLGLFA